MQPTDETGVLQLAVRPVGCPFYQPVAEGAFPGLDYNPNSICASDPEDLVEPSETYSERYCTGDQHRECARFRAAIAATRRQVYQDPFAHGKPPLLAVLANPLVLAGMVAFGVIIGLLGPLLVTPGPGLTRNEAVATPDPNAPTEVQLPPVLGTPVIRTGTVVNTGDAGLAVRAEPNRQAPAVATAPEGATLQILGQRESDGMVWYQVRFNQSDGWSAASFVRAN
jgi:hypothetical protein